MYFAFVYPHLLHGIEVYANTDVTHLTKLITLNNKILRILQNKPYNTPVIDLYTAYNTLPIPQLHSQQLGPTAFGSQMYLSQAPTSPDVFGLFS